MFEKYEKHINRGIKGAQVFGIIIALLIVWGVVSVLMTL